MREYAHKDIQLMLPLRITLLVGIASIILSINLTQQYNTFIFVSCQRNMFDFVPTLFWIYYTTKDSWILPAYEPQHLFYYMTPIITSITTYTNNYGIGKKNNSGSYAIVLNNGYSF